MTIPTGYGQINLRFSGSATVRLIETTFGFKNDASETPLNIAGFVASNWHTNLRSQTMTSYTLDTVHVKMGPDDTGPFLDYTVAEAGTQSGATLPPNVSFLIKKSTVHGGRKGRGRMYYPALGEGFVDNNGDLASGVAAASTVAFAAFITQLATDGIPMYLLHHDSTTPYEVTTLSCEARVATQRRRNRA